MLFGRGISFGSMLLIVFGKIMMKTKTDGTVACFLLNLSRDEKEENVRKSRETIFPFHNIIMYLLSQSYLSLPHSSAVCQASLRIRIFSIFCGARTKILLSNITRHHQPGGIRHQNLGSLSLPPRLPPATSQRLLLNRQFIYCPTVNAGDQSQQIISFHGILVIRY